MVSTRPNDCRKGSWLLKDALRSGVAALVALGGHPSIAFAQVIGQDVTAQPADACAPIGADRPVRLAMLPLKKLEPAAGPTINSKSAAILGGAPSRLEQMRMAQAIGDADACVATSDIAETLPIAATGSFLPENAILGSLSLSVKHTPFDRDWAVVSAKQGARKMQRALTATGARKSGDQAAQVEAINRWVNREIAFGEDRDVYGRADYWAPAGETLRRGVGDCEDFAIAKMELLSALGVSREKMRLVVARDLVRNADHAVLVVTLADGAVMLDNMTDRLLDARLPNDYRPIMSFSQNAKWVHGYAVQPAQPIRMATVNAVPVPAARDMLEVIAVTQEPEMPALSIALLTAPLALPTSL